MLLQPIFYGAAQLNIAGKQAPSYVDVDADFDDGSVRHLARPRDRAGGGEKLGGVGRMVAPAASMVDELEDRGGSQIAAAGMQGRWVLPWVGGWQRLHDLRRPAPPRRATDDGVLGGGPTYR